jgi:hypothetical protein
LRAATNELPVRMMGKAGVILKSILRAIETNGAIMQLQLVQRWALTYAYAYPGLPKFVVLRALKKFTQRRLSWQQYLDQVDIGRLRVWAELVK